MLNNHSITYYVGWCRDVACIAYGQLGRHGLRLYCLWDMALLVPPVGLNMLAVGRIGMLATPKYGGQAAHAG